MAILNYTTSIKTEKTVSEIQKRLAAAKAQAVLSEYDDNGITVAMSFKIRTSTGTATFRLPANIEGVYQALKRNRKVPNRLKTYEQASRVSWRILKDWIEAQLAIVEAEMVDMVEVFLPYVQDESGQTLYEAIKSGGFKQITMQS